MRLRRAAPVLLLAALPMLAPGAAEAAARWRVVPSPSPSDQANYLSAAAAVTAGDVWAVGAWYRSHTTSTPGTLTEHWDGTAWTVVPSPNATDGYNELYGVAAVSSTDVWAVGYHNIANYGSEKTMALHWNGTNWALVPTANIGPNANELKAVAALARGDVWAVGFGASTNNQVGVALAQHWNGQRWSLTPTPSLGAGFAGLNGVDSAGPGDVWAVGSHGDDTLIEHWNGSAWSVVASPNGARPENELYAVSVVAPDDVWAVGESSGGSGSDTLIEHWDGSSWTVVPGPNGSKPFTSLTGVTAVGPSNVWAVGSTYEPLHAVFRTFTAHWDGATWTAVPSPNPSPEYDFLQGVTAVPGAGPWAVGAADVATLAMQIRAG
jgi:hypothetical protein